MLILDSDRAKKSREKVNSAAELYIPPFYGDNAVFQHGKTTVIKGKTRPKTKVYAESKLFKIAIFSNHLGEFTLRIPPQKPVKVLDITVSAAGRSVTLNNISFGNVYLCSGQSNMAMIMKNARPSFEAVKDHDLSLVRCFKAEQHHYYGQASELHGKWLCGSENVLNDFSAIAGFFAAEASRASGIVTAVIDTSYGGVNIESWISEFSLLSSNVYKNEASEYEANSAVIDLEAKSMPENDKKLLKAWYDLFPAHPDDGGIDKGYCSIGYNDSEWDSMLLPDSWTQAGHNHAGIFYFRKHIILPENSENHTFTLSIGAVDKADRTFVNGVPVGNTGDMRKTSEWNSVRVYKVPQGIFRSGENIIAVQAASLVSIFNDGGLTGPAEEMFLVSEDETIRIPLTGNWKIRETFNAGTIGMTCMHSFGQGAVNSFHILFDNLIHPMAGTALAGVLWYQGEANAICLGQTYKELLTLMINDWRRNFLDPELNFYIIQLPECQTAHLFAPYATWPLIREAQLLAALDTNCTPVVTLGYGDALDIHPTDKLSVAKIIAKMELAAAKGEKDVIPHLVSLAREGSCLTAQFNSDLDTSDDPQGFVISGADGIAYKAAAEFCGKRSMKFYSEELKEPEAIWYAWAENPRYHTLKTASQIAVSPFRAAIGENIPRAVNLIDQ